MVEEVSWPSASSELSRLGRADNEDPLTISDCDSFGAWPCGFSGHLFTLVTSSTLWSWILWYPIRT